jgi:hypothetical protein
MTGAHGGDRVAGAGRGWAPSANGQKLSSVGMGLESSTVEAGEAGGGVTFV